MRDPRSDSAAAGSPGDLPVILLVDDDDATRARLHRAVDHRYGHDYDAIGERSAADAMDRLQALHDDGRPVALIIADHWMPAETGADFLARSRHLHPTAQRMLLTDWGDFTALGATVHSMVLGEIETWIARPFGHDDEEFHLVVTTALARWSREHGRGAVALTIVGNPYDTPTAELRHALARILVPFRFVDAASLDGQARLDSAGIDGPLPVVIMADGRALPAAGAFEVAGALGMQATTDEGRVDVAVIGGGPAGLAAAVYGATEGLSVTLIEPSELGGQASSSPMLRNYLGFPAGVTGGELTARAFQQAITFGARFVIGRSATDLRADGDDRVVTLNDGTDLRAGSVVIATGVSYRRMGIESLEALVGRGVYYGSGTSEAPGLAGERVYVVGGANSAGSAAVHLARHAGHVTILVRGPTIVDTMSDYLIREIDAAGNIDVRPSSEIVDAGGDFRLKTLSIRDRIGDTIEEVPAAAVFILIGAAPRTAWLPDEIARDDHGFILTGEQCADPSDRLGLATTMPGVFAAGDVRLHPVKRVASAVGDGSTAIREIHEDRIRSRGQAPVA
jgi:thioredoxin reductase (NADPH)